MNTLSPPLSEQRLVLVLAHPDDELHVSAIGEMAQDTAVVMGTYGEATTLNYSGRSLCLS